MLAAFVLTATWYSLALPPGEGVDEQPHVSYVVFVKERHGLPVQPRSPEGGVDTWMGHHPPLYYALGAAAVAWADTSDFARALRFNPHFVWDENNGRNGWNVLLHPAGEGDPWHGTLLALHALRLLGVALGALALWALGRCVRRLLPGREWAPAGALALVGLNPSFVFMVATVHHDVLQAALFGLATWWALAYLDETERPPAPWWGGVLLGLALLTKLSGLVLVPALGLALLLRAWREHEWRDLPARALGLYAPAAALAGWWFARNQWLYGDPFAWGGFVPLQGHVGRTAPYTLNDLRGFLGLIGRTYWGAFGYMHVTFAEITRPLWWLCGLAGLGLAVAAARARRLVPGNWPAWSVAGVILLGLLAAYVRLDVTTGAGGHGRYLFPAAPFIGAALVAGLNGLAGRRLRGATSALLAAGMLGFAVWLPLTQVLPRYAPPAPVAADEAARRGAPLATFGEGLALAGTSALPASVSAGEWLNVTLYWRAAGDPARRPDGRARLTLSEEDDASLGAVEAWPVAGVPPELWPEGTVYATRLTLQAPQDGVTSGRLSVRLALLGRDGQTLPARGADGAPLPGGAVPLGRLPYLSGVSSVATESVPNPRREVFAGALALRGVELPSGSVPPGGTAAVTLYWEVLAPPPADYTVFLQLMDANGSKVASFDRPPGGGASPTSAWRPGPLLREAYPLPIPPDAPPGEHTLWVGLYTWPSLERAPVTLEGAPAGDAVAVGRVTVGK